jgi:hypothetical protein
MARPSSSSGKRGASKEEGLDPTKNFEDLGDSIMNSNAPDDVELRQMLSQIGVDSPDQIQ